MKQDEMRNTWNDMKITSQSIVDSEGDNEMKLNQNVRLRKGKYFLHLFLGPNMRAVFDSLVSLLVLVYQR